MAYQKDYLPLIEQIYYSSVSALSIIRVAYIISWGQPILFAELNKSIESCCYKRQIGLYMTLNKMERLNYVVCEISHDKYGDLRKRYSLTPKWCEDIPSVEEQVKEFMNDWKEGSDLLSGMMQKNTY